MTRNIFQTVLLIIFIFSFLNIASAEDMIIFLYSDKTSVSEGDFVTVSVYYDVTDKNKNLNAMGARIHFDSSKMTYKGTKNFLYYGSLLKDAIPAPQNESEAQTDNEPLTDKVLLFSYANFSGGWPGSYYIDSSIDPPKMVTISLPLKLADLIFQINDQTKMNVTQSTGDNAYGFKGTGLEFSLNTVEPLNYTISATAGDNGIIIPSGIISVNSLDNQTFFFQADEGFLIDKILVDNIQIETVDSYRFNHILQNHTIEVSFKPFQPEYILEIEPNDISIDKNFITTEVKINANNDWSFLTSNQWLSITRNGQTLIINIDENSGADRSGKITIKLKETNISKTINILQKGQTECSIVHTEETSGLISDTNQTITDVEIDGDIVEIDGDDGDYLITPPSFTKLNQYGETLSDSAEIWSMVRDNVTGLIWEVKTDDESIRDKDNTFYWFDSNPETNGGNAGNDNELNTENYINQLNEYRLFCHSDWRMPTLNELATLINYGKTSPAAFVKYFPNMQSQKYWSSSSYNEDSSYAICIDFSIGSEYFNKKAIKRSYIRAVIGQKRAGQEKRFVEKGNNILVDTHTGLVWALQPTTEMKNFKDAVSFCENLVLSGNENWRIPTIAEIRSILDYNINIEQIYFEQGEYWSGTLYSKNEAWCFNYPKEFSSNISNITNTYNVIAVSGGQNIIDNTIIINEPEQGQLYWKGYNLPIHWETETIEGPVKILITREFVNTEIIVEKTQNTGYFDWIITGPVTDNAKIRIASVNDPSKFGELSFFSIKETHFIPEWHSKPYIPMSLFIKKIENINLSYGDEIGIFDNNKCVGRSIYERKISEKDMLKILCSADDGYGNGFIEGNDIKIKIWITDDQLEIVDVYAQYFDMSGNPVVKPVFVKNSGYKIVLSQKLIISPSTGEGGNIEPFVPIYLENGKSQTFKIIADSCHRISNVFIDGNRIGPVDEYTFNDVQTNHEIKAIFNVKTFTIDSSSKSGGEIVPSGILSYTCSSNPCFIISGNDEYTDIGNVVVDNVSKGSLEKYCFMDIQENHTIEADFQFSQEIKLLQGWNTISFKVAIDNNAFDSLKDDNNLIVVRDESANEIINNMGTWYYNIRDIKCSQGYRVKVNESTTFTVKGPPCEFPQEITLKQNNIIGFPCLQEKSAFNFFKPLRDTNLLKSVMDQNGNMLVEIENDWDNGIGNLISGNGYLLRTTEAAVNKSFEIYCSDSNKIKNYSNKRKSIYDTKSIIIQTKGLWKTVWNPDMMNPNKSMNIWVIGLNGSYALQTGDIIAVFDDNACVGMETITGEISKNNPLIIKTSMKNEDTDGFTEGHLLRIKVWNTKESHEFSCVDSVFYNELSEKITKQVEFEPEGHVAVSLNVNSGNDDNNIKLNDIILGLKLMTKFNDNANCLMEKNFIKKPLDLEDIIFMMQKIAGQYNLD